MIRTAITDSLEARLAGLPPPPAPMFPFPWDGLEEYLAKHQEDQLRLVGYGSLLKKSSADMTIGEGAQRTPCLAFGCRRIFNYAMPEAVLKRRSIPRSSPYKAALNVVATGDFRDVINGMLIAVNGVDILALKQREFGYDLVSAYCLPWHNPDQSPLTIAYVLCAPDVAPKPEHQVTDSTILPAPDYALLCEEGAAEVSPEFLDMYLNTTYLADKVTLWKC